MDSVLPYLDQLMEDPLHFSLTNVLPVVSDAEEDIQPVKTHTSMKGMDMSNNTFCDPMMMMMGAHDMTRYGIGSMSHLGGGMSSGMIMYMDGFRFSMAGRQPCLNLYFPSWTLDTRFKFLLALIFVFALAFSAEAISKYRHNLSKRPTSQNYQERRTRQMIISGLHGFQALLGYIVMLATMTFSLEILLSVVLGLSAGYYYFFAGEIGLEGHVTTNPCCNFMQDESDEHEQRQQVQQAEAAAANPLSPPAEDAMTTGLLVASGEPECLDSPAAV